MANRRQFLSTAAMATAGVILSPFDLNRFGLSVAEASEPAKPKTTLDGYADLVDKASDCIKTGEACSAHCQNELAKGNKKFAKCNTKVHEMLVMTKGLLTLASMDSSLVPKYASVCIDACKSCIEACEEHKEHFSHGMHLQCKACMEACTACEKACEKVV